MMSVVQSYLDLIQKERSWSWAVVCLLYVLAALFVRSWFVGPLFSKMKSMEKKTAGTLKSEYLKRSFIGWLLFFLPLVLIVVYWRRDVLPFKIHECIMMAGGGASFVLSMIFHLQAFGMAGVATLASVQPGKAPSDH